MSFIKLERPREFKIETFYYNQDEPVDPKRRIQFKRIRHSKRAPKANPVRLIFVILLLVFVIFYLQKKANVFQGSSAPGKIEVKELIIID